MKHIDQPRNRQQSQNALPCCCERQQQQQQQNNARPCRIIVERYRMERRHSQAMQRGRVCRKGRTSNPCACLGWTVYASMPFALPDSQEEERNITMENVVPPSLRTVWYIRIVLFGYHT